MDVGNILRVSPETNYERKRGPNLEDLEDRDKDTDRKTDRVRGKETRIQTDRETWTLWKTVLK